MKFLNVALPALLVVSYVFFAWHCIVLKNTLFEVEGLNSTNAARIQMLRDEVKFTSERLRVFEYCQAMKDEKEAQCLAALL